MIRAATLLTIALAALFAAACDNDSSSSGGGGGGGGGTGSGAGGAIVGNMATANELSLADQVFLQVNQERANNSLPALSHNTAMAQVAYDHSWDMQNRNFFAHTNPGGASPFDRLTAAGISYSNAGENIARGYATPAAVMAAWMASSGHRANILNANYTEIGVGVREGSGGPWWTQVFRRP